MKQYIKNKNRWTIQRKSLNLESTQRKQRMHSQITLKIKAIGELLNLRFYIPNYQRGYRWKQIQVKDLLNDIADFISSPEKSSDFYCLQPLVVKETVPNPSDFINDLPKADSDRALQTTREAIAKNTRWEVIDGQQRLTTIYLILSYLAQDNNERYFDKEQLYELAYETRSDSADFLQNIGTGKAPKEHSVDFLFMNKAYNTIAEWFKDKDSAYRELFTQNLLNKVKFIWYETTEKSTTVFKRLNLGKIGLTNAELIKALFLNRSNFRGSEHKKIIIASQWDEFESRLQNDDFWLFIHSPQYDKPTRMEFIFNLICDMNILDEYIWPKEIHEENNKNSVIGTDKYRTFRYFDAFFKSASAHQAANAKDIEIIELCWMEVKGIFRVFEEWYTDLKLYHYVGFLINEGMSVTELLKLWSTHYNPSGTDDKTKSCSDKMEFLEALKKKIKEKIAQCRDLEQQYEIDGSCPKTACRPLLLLHNIQTVIDQNKGFSQREDYKLGVFYKFPFHLYKKESWNVEHIDSNTTNELDTETEKMNWLRVSWYFLPDKHELRDEIKKYMDEKDAEKKNFEKLHLKILQHFESKGGSMNKEEKNQIKNFVLLDEHTNKSYGNAIFPMKKMVISGKDHCWEYQIKELPKDQDGKFTGIDIEIITRSDNDSKYKTAFVPPVTKAAFMKEFNPLSANPYSWDNNDAEKYKENIETTLKDFLQD